MGGIGVFLIASALVVLFPVVLQIRMGESRFSDVWGYLIFVLGLLVAASGDSRAGRPHQLQLVILGIVIALAGLLAQPKSPPDQRQP
jgi:hypothetical protein